jgi:hypothetical protein
MDKGVAPVQKAVAPVQKAVAPVQKPLAEVKRVNVPEKSQAIAASRYEEPK